MSVNTSPLFPYPWRHDDNMSYSIGFSWIHNHWPLPLVDSFPIVFSSHQVFSLLTLLIEFTIFRKLESILTMPHAYVCISSRGRKEMLQVQYAMYHIVSHLNDFINKINITLFTSIFSCPLKYTLTTGRSISVIS